MAAVGGADGVDPRAPGGGEILGAVQATARTQLGQHVVHDPALVETSPALGRDFAQRPRQRREHHPLADRGQGAAGQQQGCGVGIVGQQIPLQPPVAAHARVHREANLGIDPRRLDDPRQVPAAEALVQGDQAIHGPGDRHCVRVLAVDLAGPGEGGADLLQRRRRRRAARAVEPVDRHFPTLRIEREHIPAQPHGLRLDHALHQTGSHGCIDRVAPSASTCSAADVASG